MSDDYAWPEPCRESLLAQFAADRETTQADNLARLLSAHTSNEEDA